MIPLEKKTKEKPQPIKISKFLEIRVLLEKQELEALFDHLSDFSLLNTAEIVGDLDFEVQKRQYIDFYKDYLDALQEGSTASSSLLNTLPKKLTLAMSSSLDEICVIEVKENKYLLRPIKPVIQLRPHTFHFIHETKKFHSMVMGEDRVYFGLQFSYPQIFQDPVSHEIVQTLKDSSANTALFKKLRLWMRSNTKPTPFLVDGKKIVSTIRIGKECSSWVNHLKNLTPLEVLFS